MLTLVAAVLAYDIAREMCEVRDAASLMVEAADVIEASPRGRRASAGEPRIGRSCTRLEKDIVALKGDNQRSIEGLGCEDGCRGKISRYGLARRRRLD